MDEKSHLAAAWEQGTMRIAFVSDAVYPYNKGGKENRLYEIARRLAKRGHDVHIYCMKWWGGPKKVKQYGVTLHGISPYFPLYNKEGKRSMKQAIGFALYVLPGLLAQRFDILDVDQMPYFPVFPAWIVSKLKRKPMVVTWHEHWGNYWYEYLGKKGAIGWLVERLSEMFTPRAIVVSKHTAQRLHTRPMHIIPNGIDVQAIDDVEPSKKHYDILFAGRLIYHKNVDLLIQVANKKGYKTLIIGAGPEEKRLRRMAKKNIHFQGFSRDQSTVFAQMKSAKAFVYLSEREGFGIALLEALACGTPVITSNKKHNAGKSLIRQGYNGYICSLTESDVENAIDLCLKNNAQMKAHAAASAKGYDWDAIVDKIERVYAHE